MKPNLKKILKYLLSASLAVVLLWFSFRGVDWNKFWLALSEVNWGFVVLSMVAGSVAFWLRALRWRRLLLPLDDSISRTTAFNGVNIANISNFVFPRIGEFVRCGVVVRRSEPIDPSDPLKKKASYDKVLGTVVLERAWELVVMLLLLAVVVVGGFDRYGPFFVNEIWQSMTLRKHVVCCAGRVMRDFDGNVLALALTREQCVLQEGVGDIPRCRSRLCHMYAYGAEMALLCIYSSRVGDVLAYGCGHDVGGSFP